ncbi:MAG TPA: trypsin-like peptidase domain-containing protein [Vicinamibacterales bacterium]|nr:trypsin-like peptidase domain-containing protein [Vicinamibacterales bacterium]
MLLFEFFPAFVALVSIVAGIWLFLQNLEADDDPDQPERDTAATRPVTRGGRNKAAAIGFIAVLLSASTALAQTRTSAAMRATDLSETFETTARVAGPAVVQIFATSYRVGNGLVPSTAELITTERASGSGVIVDAAGYIVTNAHVVASAQRVRVELQGPVDGQSILASRNRTMTGEIVGMDRETDLAVIKVDGQNLPVLAFADSDQLRAGQLVMAFGSPLGLNNSVSLGIVSAVARQLEPESPMVYVQTDASINHGSSGGPLVDLHGRIVGINTLIVSQAGGDDGLGFAAPSNIVRTVYEHIRKHGRVRRGDTGIRAQTVTPGLARGLSLPIDHGVVLADVAPRSSAARAGLQPGDLVLALDGKPMENGRQLHVGLYRRFVGDVVSFRDPQRWPADDAAGHDAGTARRLQQPPAAARSPRKPGGAAWNPWYDTRSASGRSIAVFAGCGGRGGDIDGRWRPRLARGRVGSGGCRVCGEPDGGQEPRRSPDGGRCSLQR